jgi:hypothetical protein
MTTKKSEEVSNAITKSRDWLYRGGDYPGDEAAATAAKQLIDEWLQWRRQGMDVLASRCIDEVMDMCKEARDIA